MFTFQQFCELMTQEQRYAWFNISKKYIASLNKEELNLVHLEVLNIDYDVRLWYPKKKFFSLNDDAYKRHLRKAIEDGNFELIKQLKESRKQ